MSTINLLNAMDAHNVTQLIFSSTATVYGEPDVRFELPFIFLKKSIPHVY
jgi:UDP-glucose 4-epimerase